MYIFLPRSFFWFFLYVLTVLSLFPTANLPSPVLPVLFSLPMKCVCMESAALWYEPKKKPDECVSDRKHISGG